MKHRADRDIEVHARLFSYQSYKAQLQKFEDSTTCRSSASFEAQIRSNVPSDPTARAAIALASMPKDLAEKRAWCCVIESAWAECVEEDKANGMRLAEIMERNFYLTGDPHGRDGNLNCRAQICADLEISESTFFARLRTITGIVVYHAAVKGLV
jgi:hypothetical protein